LTPQELKQLADIKKAIAAQFKAIAKRTPKTERMTNENGDIFSVKVDGKQFNLSIQSGITNSNKTIR
jgi:hypothetical protein